MVLSAQCDILRSLDPAAIFKECGLVADRWQLDVLRSEASRLALCCCRQSGKSTCVAAKAAHTAIYEPEALVLVLSPSERQSSELGAKISSFLHRLEGVPIVTAESELKVRLQNGSRIMCLASNATTARGFSKPTLILLDEASRIENSVIHAILPSMAHGKTKLICLSTPAGLDNWFAKVWHDDPAFERVSITWRQCPRISSEEVAAYERMAGSLMTRQEFCCEFIETDELQMFDGAAIDALFTPDVEAYAWL